MKKSTTPNERIKRDYFIRLKDALGRDEATIDAVAKALNRFEIYTKFQDFKQFNIEQARGFKANLATQANVRTRQKLSAATRYSTLRCLKAFFQWLADQPDYKHRIKYAHADYFNPSDKDVRIATARREKRGPTIEQIRQVINNMPTQTDIEKRNRALIAFTLLSGARDAAIASFKLKHIDIETSRIEQDAREVNTKRSKTVTSYFFPAGDDVRTIVVDWINYLRNKKNYGDDDPLFPATERGIGPDRCFVAIGLTRENWKTTAPIRAIFKNAFLAAGLPYFNPHSFRNTLAQLAYELKLGPEELRAWSQNLSHESILTTLSSYGQISNVRQQEILADLAKPRAINPEKEEIVKRIAELAAQL